MPNWIEELTQNIHLESGAKPAVATLATVRATAAGNQADARCVIIRNIDSDGTLIITSDARSEKNAQLRANASAAMVFWFPSSRRQFIVDAMVMVLGAEDSSTSRLNAWRLLSDATRATFHWPTPGRIKHDDEQFSGSVSADAPAPVSFEVLLLRPTAVETLDLNSHPHTRIKWSRDGGGLWNGVAVNP